MDPLTTDEIRRSFVNVSRTRAKQVPPPEGLREIDFSVLDYLGWVDPKAPSRAYLVLPDPRGSGVPVGIGLRIAGVGTQRRGAALCELCRAARPAMDVSLFTAPRAGAAGREGNTVGTYLCTDLACSHIVRGLKELEGPQPETLTTEERIERLTARLGAFVERVRKQ